MGHIFISHAERDLPVANEIIRGLESSGYSTWYFERDMVPGTSYIANIAQAIEQSQAVVLVVSSDSLDSDQVSKEVVGAFERRKPFFPVLVDMTPPQFKERQPEWRHVLGSTTMIYLSTEGIQSCAARIIEGLKAMGIQPDAGGMRLGVSIGPAPAPASYTPRHLADRIIAARPSIEGERKQVTVLIGDVAGFTSSAGMLDPEEEHGMIRQCLGVFADEIHRYEGTIIELKGDHVVAFFGAPIAHEYAPQRAIYAALGIQQRLSRYAEQLKEKGMEFHSRISVNTGPIVITKIGYDLSMEYTAVGDTVSLASELHHSAEAGMILASDNTHNLTQEYFEFSPAGEVKVRGKKESIKSYRVLGLGKARTRLRAAMGRGLTPFVGRERELELLMDGLERAKEGNGQALSIMGEAGVGKSRLLHEFREAIAKDNVTFLEGRCLSYSTGVVYHPFVEILKSNFRIIEGDDDNMIRDKVEKGFKLARIEEAQTLPYILELLSVRDSGIDTITISPEARKVRTMEALKRLVLKGSEIRPLIFAIEDLHWVDRGTEETLKYLMDNISGAQVLAIFTYRPEFVHTWGGRSYHSQVALNRLSNRESLAMVSHLIGTDEIEKRLKDLILKKTEGIPFFIEEFIRSLKDLGMIERKDTGYYLARDVEDLAIPSTIQEVIMARVDSLPEAAKGVLQTGSAIEREFSYELIKRVTGISELELVSHLSVLRDSELLYERGIFPQSSFIFKHALTREVVYDSILTSRKKRLHVEIGNAIEDIYKDTLDEHYAVLAEHYIAGENYEKGAEYCRLAGRRAEKVASLNDAIAYSERRIACLERLMPSEGLQINMIDARVTLGLYYLQMGLMAQANSVVEPIIELAKERRYKRRISQIFTIIGCHTYCIKEDYPAALQYFSDALQIAEELADPLSMAMANLWMGQALSHYCRFEEAFNHLEKALDINIAANTTWGIATMKSLIGGYATALQGRLDLGYEVLKEAIELAEESGDTYSKVYAYISHGMNLFQKGFLKDAEVHLAKGVDLARSINFNYGYFTGLVYLIANYIAMEEYTKSQTCLDELLAQLSRTTFIPTYTYMTKILMASTKLLGRLGDISLGEVIDCYKYIKVEAIRGWMANYVGEILMNVDEKHMSEAEEWINKAIELDRKNGTRLNLAKDYALYGEYLKRKGDMAMAREKLGKAIEIFKECGADGWVKRSEEELAKL